MAEIQVHAADGAILHFPKGTPDTAIQSAIRSHINQVMQPPAPVDQVSKNAAAMHTQGPMPNGSPSDYLLDNPILKSGEPSDNIRNTSVDVVRNIAAPAAAIAGGTFAAPSASFTRGVGPIVAGTAAYALTDAALKQLKSSKTSSVSDDLKNSALQGLLNEVGGRLIGGTIKAGKAFNALGTPDPESLLNLSPTASQALASTGDHPILASITKFLEDHFAGGSKAAAQANSAQLGIKGGMAIAAKEAGRSPSTIANPNDMVKLITGEMVPAETQAAGKIVPRTADYQPIEIVPQKNSFIDRGTGVTPITQTRVTGPVQQVPIPGAYEILPGVIKKTPFATDTASLDALLRDDTKLQNALTKSQAAGLGINVRQDLAGYRLARLQQSATNLSNGVQTIDPDKVLKGLSDPEMSASNKILFKGSNGLAKMQQFYKNLATTQDTPGTSRILRYANTIGIPMSLMHSAISGNMAGVAAAGGMVGMELSAAAIAKALTNPQSARLMLALANKEALGVSDQYAARMIAKAISGTTVNLVSQDGTKTPMQMGANGELK